MPKLHHRRLNLGTVNPHMAARTESGPASVVPRDAVGDAAELDEGAPDATWDFLDGDGMVLDSEARQDGKKSIATTHNHTIGVQRRREAGIGCGGMRSRH